MSEDNNKALLENAFKDIRPRFKKEISYSDDVGKFRYYVNVYLFSMIFVFLMQSFSAYMILTRDSADVYATTTYGNIEKIEVSGKTKR